MNGWALLYKNNVQVWKMKWNQMVLFPQFIYFGPTPAVSYSGLACIIWPQLSIGDSAELHHPLGVQGGLHFRETQFFPKLPGVQMGGVHWKPHPWEWSKLLPPVFPAYSACCGGAVVSSPPWLVWVISTPRRVQGRSSPCTHLETAVAWSLKCHVFLINFFPVVDV